MEGWLSGWKSISKYIGRSVKTTKKYYKQYGMTVRRGPKNTPIALPYELDRWLINFDEIKVKMKSLPKKRDISEISSTIKEN